MRKNRVEREMLTRLMAGPRGFGDLQTKHRLLEQMDPIFYAEVAAWYARLLDRPAYRRAICIPFDDLVGKESF